MRRLKRPRLAEPEPLEELLERAGDARFAPSPIPIPARDWSQAVGPRIADRARPVALKDGVLTLRVTTSAWATELAMLKPWILERLESAGFGVKDLRFRVGPLELPPRPPERRTTRVVPPPAALPPDLTEQLKAIADPELREAMALAARANLAWHTHVGPRRRR